LNKIQSLCSDADFEKDPFIKEFGLHVDTSEMVKVTGRVLEAPKLSVGEDPATRHTKPKEGVWSETEKFYLPATCNSYALISFMPEKEYKEALV
jgi:hypothetical protein